MTASDRRRPREQTPEQALADWVNEGGSFLRPPRHRDESGDSVGDERLEKMPDKPVGFRPLGNIGELLALQAAGRRPGAPASGTGDGTGQ